MTPSEKRVYADHAATTPVRDEVAAAMWPHLGAGGFNPSSLHAEGRAARAAVDDARAVVAGILGAKPREIVFTAGGSEADNLAILGVARAAGPAPGRPHVVTGATEHHAVLEACRRLGEDGYEVTVLPVDGDGLIPAESFANALRPRTVLASLMLANNELGTLHPIALLAGIARRRGVVFHTDAVQAPGRLALDVDELGVDALSLSAHKFYGPKGVGALYVRSGTALAPQILGGSQEGGLRAGTENVAGIVGFARALELASRELPEEARRLASLRDRFEAGVLAAVPGVAVNAAGAARLPNLSSLAFAGVSASDLLVHLDLAGVAVSAGSACSAGSTTPSHVLTALGLPTWAARGTIRFSFGKLTSEQDVEALLRMLPAAVAAVRVGGPDLGKALAAAR
jgi:cysteine desulfurase